MPWLAFPPVYGQPKGELEIQKKKILNQHKIQSVPTLYILNAKTGEIITKFGKPCMASESYAEDFPFHPKP